MTLPNQVNNPDEWIPARSIAVVRWEQVRTLANGKTYRFVEFPGIQSYTISGWVDVKDIQPLIVTLQTNAKANDELQVKTFSEFLNRAISNENDRKDLQERFSSALENEREKIDALRSGRTFSDLIRIADDELREIFALAQTSYAENLLLSPRHQHYEPYFARAKAWAEAGYYPEAMFDYFDGLEIIKRLPAIEGHPESAFLLYQKHFNELTSTVRAALSQPFSVATMGRKTNHTAGQHFSRGYTQFWDAESNKNRQLYQQALQSFSNAISVEFYVPVYWYYRGLAYKRLGQKNQAIYCFLLASQMEKMTVENIENNECEREHIYPVHLNSSFHLTRFQGEERVWLERIRWGDPSNQLLKDYYEDVFPNH